jgi:hypothetical protein
VSRDLLTDLNAARTRVEGLAPLRANWARFYHLPIAQQLFVLANIDRVTRGLSSAVAMTSQLDADSLLGARRQADPSPTAKAFSQYMNYSSNWAQAPLIQQASMFAQFGWMYNDGPPPYVFSRNLDCATAHSPGCWGHREGILIPAIVDYMGQDPNCASTLYMGAASARESYGLSVTEAFANAQCEQSSGIAATWPTIAQELQLPVSESGFLSANETFHPAQGAPIALASDSVHVWALVDHLNGTSSLIEWLSATGALVRHVALSGMPTSIADDGNNLWVLEPQSQSVVEVSGATGGVLATVPVGQAPVAVSSSAGVVWVTNSNDGTVTEIDAASATVLATIVLPPPANYADMPSAITSSGTHAWVAVGGSEIAELDTSGAVLGTFQAPNMPTFLADDGTDLWMSDYYRNLVGLNEASGTLSSQTTIPLTLSALMVCGGRLFAVDGAVSVYAIHAGTSGETIGPRVSHVSLASMFGPATCVGSSLWLGDQSNQTVDRVPLSAF